MTAAEGEIVEAAVPVAGTGTVIRETPRVNMAALVMRANLGRWTKRGFEVAVSQGELPLHSCDDEWTPDPLPIEWTYAPGQVLHLLTTTSDAVTQPVRALLDDTRCVQHGTVLVLLDAPPGERPSKDDWSCPNTVLAFPVGVNPTARLRCPTSSPPTRGLLANLEAAGIHDDLIGMPAYDEATDEWTQGVPLPQGFDLAAHVESFEVRRQTTVMLVIVSPPEDRRSIEGNGTDLVFVVSEDGGITPIETADQIRLMVVTDLDGDGYEEVFFEEAYHEGGTVAVLDLRDLAVHRLWSEGM